jgi:uncharacterized protein
MLALESPSEFRLRRLSFAFFASMLALHLFAQSAGFDKAVEAYRAKNFSTALALARPLAEQNDPDAQLLLAWMHQHGEGVPEDMAEAAKWCRKAAELGNAKAQHNLGTHYQFGFGVTKDMREAALWYRKAAEQGDPSAQLRLGQMCERGEGVDKDLVQAYAWYLQANESLSDVSAHLKRVGAKLNKAQLAEAKRLAQKAMEQLAKSAVRPG